MSEDMGMLMIGFDDKSLHMLVELGLMTENEELEALRLVQLLQRAEQKITSRASVELMRMLHEFFADDRIGLAWAVTQHLTETSVRFTVLPERRKAEILVKLKEYAMERMREAMKGHESTKNDPVV